MLLPRARDPPSRPAPPTDPATPPTLDYYQVLAEKPLNEYCVKLKVDIRLNHHWTDLVCGVDDTQVSHVAHEKHENRLPCRAEGNVTRDCAQPPCTPPPRS